jgi:hypothetical protein
MREHHVDDFSDVECERYYIGAPGGLSNTEHRKMLGDGVHSLEESQGLMQYRPQQKLLLTKNKNDMGSMHEPLMFRPGDLLSNSRPIRLSVEVAVYCTKGICPFGSSVVIGEC